MKQTTSIATLLFASACGVCRDTSTVAGSVAEFWTKTRHDLGGPRTPVRRTDATALSPIQKFTLNPLLIGLNRDLNLFGLNAKVSHSNVHQQITGVGVF